MRKEILRIQHLNYQTKAGNELKYISFYLLEGEVTGFLGLENSGKEILVDILSGELKFKRGIVNLCGERMVSSGDLAGFVYKMKDSNYLIEDWSVAEYINLVDNRSVWGILHQKTLIAEVRELLEVLQIGIDANKKLGELSEVEKRLVDVAKAYKKKARILIIEDEFDGLSRQEIEYFKKELVRVISGKMTVIVNNHSDMVTGILAGKLIIFKKGAIVKKCSTEYIQNPKYLERYLMATNVRSRKKTLDSMRLNQTGEYEIIYRVAHVNTSHDTNMEFSFRKGEITTVLALDRKEKEEIFGILSGRVQKAGVEQQIGEEICNFDDISDYVRNKIISILHLGNLEELLPSMSVGENILMPSLNKITSLEYTLAERRIVKMLEKEMSDTGIFKGEKIKKLGVNDRIALTLERWHVYSPKVIVLFEPFAQCDTYGVSLVKSYIKKIASGGSAVIVVKSREEYMEELSDRFIQI